MTKFQKCWSWLIIIQALFRVKTTRTYYISVHLYEVTLQVLRLYKVPRFVIILILTWMAIQARIYGCGRQGQRILEMRQEVTLAKSWGRKQVHNFSNSSAILANFRSMNNYLLINSSIMFLASTRAFVYWTSIAHTFRMGSTAVSSSSRCSFSNCLIALGSITPAITVCQRRKKQILYSISRSSEKSRNSFVNINVQAWKVNSRSPVTVLNVWQTFYFKY